MKKKTVILGFETSCDETAVSVLVDKGNKKVEVLSNVVSSQFNIHSSFGGVVPELAARSHLEKIDLITKKALKDSKLKLNDISAVAATSGPGLIVCLSVGVNFAKAISISLNKPFIEVNHLEGHALSPKLSSKLNYPYLMFLISGGHTQFLIVESFGKYKRIGTTIDDALGEAFDKTAKILNIGFPGGPKIEEWAKEGDENRFELPRPIYHRGGCNLSFAGLKTAVLKQSQFVKNKKDKHDLAASFQKTIIQIIKKKTQIAIEEYNKKIVNNKNLIVVGGVASNKSIRKNLQEVCKKNEFKIYFPEVKYCTDNAAMIALVGLEKFKRKQFSPLNSEIKPRWQLDTKAKFLKGAGVKI